MDRTACTEPQCLYKGDLYLDFFYCKCRRVQSRRKERKYEDSGACFEVILVFLVLAFIKMFVLMLVFVKKFGSLLLLLFLRQ